MKLIIAGGRGFDDYPRCLEAIKNLPFFDKITEIVDGDCRTGADALARRAAEELNIPNKHFPAKWNQFGKSAGPIRNAEMAYYVRKKGHLLAFWDGESNGTRNMINVAEAAEIKTTIIKY